MSRYTGLTTDTERVPERVPETRRVRNGVHSTPLHSEGGTTPQTPLFAEDDLLGTIKAFCADELTDFLQHCWIAPLGPVAAVTADDVVVVAPSHVRSWVRERYCDMLEVAASEALGRHVFVRLVDPGWSPDHDEISALEDQAAQLRRRHNAERQIKRYGGDTP